MIADDVAKIERLRAMGWWDDEDDAMWETEKNRQKIEERILFEAYNRLRGRVA